MGMDQLMNSSPDAESVLLERHFELLLHLRELAEGHFCEVFVVGAHRQQTMEP